jgi:hypothetical protein
VPVKVFQKFDSKCNMVGHSESGTWLSVCEDSAQENEYTMRDEGRGEWRKLHNE